MADEHFERRLAQESGAIRQEISALRQEMATRQDTAALRQEIAAVRQAIADARTEVIKWSFLFWTGQFLTTAGFLLVLLKGR